MHRPVSNIMIELVVVFSFRSKSLSSGAAVNPNGFKSKNGLRGTLLFFFFIVGSSETDFANVVIFLLISYAVWPFSIGMSATAYT